MVVVVVVVVVVGVVVVVVAAAAVYFVCCFGSSCGSRNIHLECYFYCPQMANFRNAGMGCDIYIYTYSYIGTCIYIIFI